MDSRAEPLANSAAAAVGCNQVACTHGALDASRAISHHSADPVSILCKRDTFCMKTQIGPQLLCPCQQHRLQRILADDAARDGTEITCRSILRKPVKLFA